MRSIDKETLDDIENFNRIAYKQYKILADLEINGKKDTDEYKKTIFNILMIRDVIQKKFASLKVSFNDLMDYDDDLIEKAGIRENNIITNVITQRISSIIYERMVMLIYFYSIENNENLVEDVDDKVKEEYISGPDYFKHVFNEDEESIINSYMSESVKEEYKIDNITEKLFAYTFLQYLNEAIKIATDKNVRKLLIITKYNFAYVYNNIENRFLTDNDDFCDQVKLYQDILDTFIKNDMFKDIDEYIREIDITLDAYYSTLASFDDTFYDNKTNAIIAYIMELLIKAYLSTNISIKLDHKYAIIRKIAVCESRRAKDAVLETGNLDEDLIYEKKIDL